MPLSVNSVTNLVTGDEASDEASVEDKIQELVIPFDYVRAEWLTKAVQDTADIRKNTN